MQWLTDLFFSHTALQAVIIISIIIAIGLALGKIRVWGISLGVTFVFFAGILAGHIGLSIDPTILHYTENLGLVLFVYEPWSQSRPRLLQFFPQRWPRAQHARPRRDDYRNSHGHTLHTPAWRAHRRRHRSAVRSHHQHPGTRSRPTGTRTGGIVGQRCRVEPVRSPIRSVSWVSSLP